MNSQSSIPPSCLWELLWPPPDTANETLTLLIIPTMLPGVSSMEIESGMVGKKGKRAEQLHRLDRVGCSPSHQLGICRGLHVINSWKRAGTGSKTAPKSSGFPQEVQTGDPTSHFSIFSGRAVYLPSFISFHASFTFPCSMSLLLLLLPGPSQRLKCREPQGGLEISASFPLWRGKGRVRAQGGIFFFVLTGFQWGLGVGRPGLGFAPPATVHRLLEEFCL